eukprot:7268646-Prymnesium_polylepis.1
MPAPCTSCFRHHAVRTAGPPDEPRSRERTPSSDPPCSHLLMAGRNDLRGAASSPTIPYNYDVESR